MLHQFFSFGKKRIPTVKFLKNKFAVDFLNKESWVVERKEVSILKLLFLFIQPRFTEASKGSQKKLEK